MPEHQLGCGREVYFSNFMAAVPIFALGAGRRQTSLLASRITGDPRFDTHCTAFPTDVPVIYGAQAAAANRNASTRR